MTNVTRWDPFAEMAGLRSTFDRLFPDIRPLRVYAGDSSLYFPVDVAETENELVVKASLPGVKAEDIDVSVTDGVLTIKAESREETESDTTGFYRRERRYGSFQRQFTLPTDVDADNAKASYQDGVLSLSLPKAEAVKPKSIKVEATKPAIEAAASS